MGKIAFVLLLIIVVMGLVGRWYYYDTQAHIEQLNQNIATLRANQAQLEQAIATSNETIERQQRDAQQFELANNTLREQLQEAESYSDDLASKLRNHNLTVLTAQRPGLIETRVNNATARLFDEMEIITGKPAPTTTE
jgi:uncharacterized protein (DUF3084 family)